MSPLLLVIGAVALVGGCYGLSALMEEKQEEMLSMKADKLRNHLAQIKKRKKDQWDELQRVKSRLHSRIQIAMDEV
jgi:hypothetical protein